MNAERLAEIRKRWEDKETLLSWGADSVEVNMVRELLDHIAQLEAQRGGAAEFNWDESYEKAKELFEWHDELSPVIYANGASTGYALAVSRFQPIPAAQVLQPGMVGVDREELMYLHAFEKYARKHGPESIQDVVGTLDHLRRAQQAKGE